MSDDAAMRRKAVDRERAKKLQVIRSTARAADRAKQRHDDLRDHLLDLWEDAAEAGIPFLHIAEAAGVSDAAVHQGLKRRRSREAAAAT